MLSFLPFLGHLLAFLVAGGARRRGIRARIADRRPVPVDEPPPSVPAGADVYLIAGEDSGDLHAANLVTALLAADPRARIRGMGGPRMAAAGCRLDFDLVQMSVMGVWPVVRSVGTFFGLFREFLRRMETEPPDVLVVVDYPGFNLRAARLARRRGVPVVGYVAPQVWAWAPWRVRRMRSAVDRLLTILPFERDLFREAGVPAAFVGHPLFEHLEREAPADDSARAGPPHRIALLPGSRRAEVESLLPWMLATARRLREEHPESEFVIPYRRPALRPLIEAVLAATGEGVPVRLEEGRTHEVLREIDFAVVASGTATLELAYYRVPMAVFYRVSRIGSILKRLLLLVRDVALVNIVAGRRVMPEYVGAADPSPAAAAEISRWIRDPRAREAARRDLAEVRARLLFTGVAARAAGFVLAAGGPTPADRRASPGSSS